MEENNVNVNVFSKIFIWMFFGLLATGIISYYTYSSGLASQMLTNASFSAILIIEVVVVIAFSLLYKRLPPMVVAILFFVYATINGFTLSTIYYVYDITSILYVLFASALLFGVFAFLGFALKKDLTKLGTIFMGVLIIAMIISVINMFVGNTIVDTVLDVVILLVFFGVTAWDMQQIKQMAMYDDLPKDKLHIYGAMMLYLDFINIFLRLLSLFGKRND